jgi:hypothetical protein
MERYDWLQNGFSLAARGWHYSQDFYGEKIQAWMNYWHGCQHGNTFRLGKFSWSQVYWSTSHPWTRNLAYKELQLEALFFIGFFSSLSVILTLSWIEIHDWPLHFFTVVWTDPHQPFPFVPYIIPKPTWKMTTKKHKSEAFKSKSTKLVDLEFDVSFAYSRVTIMMIIILHIWKIKSTTSLFYNIKQGY